MATKKLPHGSLSKFILSQPLDMKAADVVAAAKAAGMTFRPEYVYAIRTQAAKLKKKSSKKTEAPAKAPEAKKPAAKPAGQPAAKSGGQQSKSDFVRSLGKLTPKEIVAKGAELGISLTPNYIYSVRNYDSKSAKRKAGKNAPAKKVAAPATSLAPTAAPAAAAKAGGAPATSTERNLMSVVAFVGLDRALELIQHARAQAATKLGS